MDPQASPPKRMTRARAAKAGESTGAAKTTKIVTAAAKAKASRSTVTASSKRKTRADEAEDEEVHDEDDELAQPEPAIKTRARGRPKKAVAEPEPEPEVAPAPRTRGRPKRAAEPAKEEAQPTKPATRTTRAKKTAQSVAEPAAEPEKKPATRTRGAATAATKSTAAKSAATKKSVKFEEPEKENIEPAVAKPTRGKAAEASTTTGLRAKPVRRAAASTTARTTTRAAGTGKTSGQESKYEKPTPLSPKKVTQMAMHNRAVTNPANSVPESEDELAADEKTPAKPKTMAGARARGGIKFQVPRPATSDENDVEHEGTGLPTVILGSPCRRPPPSPWKDSMKTPAKRVDGVPALAQSAVRPPRLLDGEAGTQQQQQQSAFKTSFLQSPAKRPQSPIKGLDLRPAGSAQLQLGAPSPFKTSLLSPPKRPLSPNKPSFLGFASPRKQDEETIFGRTPAPKATLLATPLPAERAVEEANSLELGQDNDNEIQISEDVPEEQQSPSRPRLLFSGRMSAVLPRHADPGLDDEESDREQEQIEDQHQEQQVVAEDEEEVENNADDPMVLDEPEFAATHDERETSTPPASPPRSNAGFFGLRTNELNAHGAGSESDDEDELVVSTNKRAVPATPCPAGSRTPGNLSTVRSVNFGERSTVKRARTDGKFGFTPLANQLSAWNAGSSPLKMGRPESPGIDILCQDDDETQTALHSKLLVATASPMRNTYFEEAISSQTATASQGFDVAPNGDAESPAETLEGQVLTPEFDDVPITQEDLSLAAEANEMSLLEPGQVSDLLHEQQHDSNNDDAMSEASQEYGDENAIPIDPNLLAAAPATPQRIVTGPREFHTVSKVPLKPADDSTPRPALKRRSHSISRLPVQQQQQRPAQGLRRNATVISYSPSKKKRGAEAEQPAAAAVDEDVVAVRRGASEPPATPARSEAWPHAAGTPARTPRRDLNPALLRGAVVFVDVHTSEGADASGIFVELLAQMGARCVRSWAWNPSSPPSSSDEAAGAHSSRIGITHVVYKDGGKRTLEKVRESRGVVQCVGVSWVLDCERENKWLDEAPYYIDTTLVPRGGARRRKSMEPKTLANLNGMLVATTPNQHHHKPASSARECQSLPATPAASNKSGGSRRRDSTLWMRTPPEQVAATAASHHEDDDGDGWDDVDDGASFLTPVPKTPAPEQVARYAAAVALEATPTNAAGVMSMADGEDGDGEPLVTRTCPPKSSSVYHELGEGVLRREKDEGVLMRLMAARRKSLQFAPKVGSPLARAWQ